LKQNEKAPSSKSLSAIKIPSLNTRLFPDSFDH